MRSPLCCGSDGMWDQVVSTLGKHPKTKGCGGPIGNKVCYYIKLSDFDFAPVRCSGKHAKPVFATG